MRVGEPYTDCMTSRLELSSRPVSSSLVSAALLLSVAAVALARLTRARPTTQNRAMSTQHTLMTLTNAGLTAWLA